MTKRKFWKTIIQVEVLSEGPDLPPTDLNELAHLITEGECSGKVTTESVTKLNGKEAAKALQAQGSDPEFFQLTEDGGDIG